MQTPPFYGQRRLIFCAAVIAVAAAALFAGALTAEHFIEIITWLTAAYLGSDGIEKVSQAIKAKGATNGAS